MLKCPFHDDDTPSLAVYSDHGHCFSMECSQGAFVRRYAMAAYLLGVWDGAPENELASVRAVKQMMDSAAPIPPTSTGHARPSVYTDGEIERMAVTFHSYLMHTNALPFLKAWRGLNEETIQRYKLGWSGSHFTIPVYDAQGNARTIRYRSHPLYGGSKYEGISGRNTPCVFSLPHVISGAASESNRTLWVTEGEFDAISTAQLGGWSATTTNGAGSIEQLPDMLARLNVTVRRWAIATDMDEAGDEAAWKLAKLVPHAYRAYWPTGKDMNEYMQAGGDLQSIMLIPARNT